MKTASEFFAGYPASQSIYDALVQYIELLGTFEIRISKSQIAFRLRKNFAVVWIPGMYLKGKTASLVLTFTFPEQNHSPRWKEIVRVSPGRFTHHLELNDPGEIDDEVKNWLKRARHLAM